MRRALGLFFAGWVTLAAPAAASRVSNAIVERLDNGLTVMVLEDSTLPLVSTQVLYRVGGRTENPGETGLAHFVEHMAFRATESFPDTDVVSRIYAVGGEWHGYTWIDQTTYFETVPREHLELVLAIQADRMARLVIPAGEMEAERKAVLTELHGYENDPASLLHDAVAAASFAVHPYRNNVIGWASDVEQISHAEILAFYRRHYRSSNAILAVAGDVRAGEVLPLVRRLFGALPGGEPTPPPRAVEPPQLGERRVKLQGAGARSRFEIAWRSPAATDPDFAAFLLLQAVISGSSGANFRQDGDGVGVRPGSRLDGIGDVEDLITAFAPTAAPHLFQITGSADPRISTAEIEERIENRLAVLREIPIPAEELERARRDVQVELLLDLETTEDVAHQMAFYEGIGAFGVLQRLPDLVAAVTAEDLRQAALRHLQPWQRTIGWFQAGRPLPILPAAAAVPMAPQPPAVPAPSEKADREPLVKRLDNGMALIARRVPRIPAGVLRVVIPGTEDDPAWRHSSILIRFPAGGLAQAAAEARSALAAAIVEPKPETSKIEDPEARLSATLRDLLGANSPIPSGTVPAVISVAGDLDEGEAVRVVEQAFGDLPARSDPLGPALRVEKREEIVQLPGKAQSQIGYAVPAPPPSDPAADAWRILLYVMSHDYEGRLGKDLIARRGLLYFIDSRYQTDGRAAWVSMAAGVDPVNLDAARKRFTELMDALRTEPPTVAEIEEAKAHLLGRRITAAMSNGEITAFHAREWIEQGRLLSDEDEERRLRGVTRDAVLGVIDRFLDGVRVIVDVSPR